MLDLVIPERCAICEMPGRPFAIAVERRSPGSHLRSATAAALRVHGRSDDVPSARGEGSRSRTPAPRSSTTARRGGSCARGRNAVAGASRATRLRSSPRSFRGRWSTRSSRCRETRSARCAEATSRPAGSRSSSGASGHSRPSTCWSGGTRFRRSADWRSTSAAGTYAAASSRRELFPRRSASSTTSTPPERPRTPARAPADGSELGTFG